MNDPTYWWHDGPAHFLADTLTHINSSRIGQEPIYRCFDLSNALNKTWNAFFQYRKQRQQLNEQEIKDGRSDSQSIKELLLRGLTAGQASELCRRESVKCLAMLAPHVMNHAVLLHEEYNPNNISDRLRKKASEVHRKMQNAWELYFEKGEGEELREALLRKLADLLLIVRSNIAHGEKSLGGLDTKKADRDRLVCLATSPVIEEFFEILFDNPSQRLAVYGTLAPGQPNASQLDGLEGRWNEGVVEGIIEKRNGLQQFRWRLGGNQCSVQVICSEHLSDEFPRLDRFEGPLYRRILVPVNVDGRIVVTNIYETRTSGEDSPQNVL